MSFYSKRKFVDTLLSKQSYLYAMHRQKGEKISMENIDNGSI